MKLFFLETDETSYNITTKTVILFKVKIKYISLGMSFKHTVVAL